MGIIGQFSIIALLLLSTELVVPSLFARLEIANGKEIRHEEMILVEGGAFMMGSDTGRGSEKPVHSVKLDDYYLGKYEVTFSEYDAFCEATGLDKPGDEGWGRENRPVINVSWSEAIAYCNWLSEQEGLEVVYGLAEDKVIANWEANGYRLPTEAEWEFAARSRGRDDNWSGTSTLDELDLFANYCDQHCPKEHKKETADDGYSNTAPVGSLQANSLGIHDMSGNVWEFCWDYYDFNYYKKKERIAPKGPLTGDAKVVRGGSWNSTLGGLRCTFRMLGGNASRTTGFRLARNGV